jgi:RNA polymerase sigma factor (sigma-70 family)
MCDDERNLIARLTEREDLAWEEFCLKYSGPLLGAVRLHCGCSEEMAEEIVHMTFIRCVKAIQTFDPARGGLFGWLKAIARNEAHTLLRKSFPAKQLRLELEDQQWIEQMDHAELPDERLCRQEVRALVLDTVMELSSRQREVLTMKYLEGRRVAEMALTLGISEKAVESLLTRSRQALKENLSRRLQASDLVGGNCL